jgi:hypothetical protein
MGPRFDVAGSCGWHSLAGLISELRRRFGHSFGLENSKELLAAKGEEMKHQLEQRIAFCEAIIFVLTLTSMVGCTGVSEQPKASATNNAQPTASTPTSQNKSTDNPAVNRKEVIAEARAILQDIKVMELEGRNIPRRTKAAHEDCMNKINGRWQRARAIKQRVEKLPKVLQIYLGVAANELINCLSCDSDALSLCAQARDWIKEAEKDIAEYERGEI